MSSTSQFETIVKVNNLSLRYNLDFHRDQTFRDLFTNVLTNPIQHFSNKTEKFEVLRKIDLELKKGDRLGLVGVNGAGKSSFCRCLAGLLEPTSGSVERKGTMRAVFNASVGLVPELTGRENAYLMANFLFPELTKQERAICVEESLDFSELKEFTDISFQKYSKGMQARLSLSLVSAKPCDFLILDEVFDGADIFFQEKISKRVTDVILNSGSVVFVSHNMKQIEDICNRLVILNNSRIIYDGDVKKGMAIYKNLK